MPALANETRRVAYKGKCWLGLSLSLYTRSTHKSRTTAPGAVRPWRSPSPTREHAVGIEEAWSLGALNGRTAAGAVEVLDAIFLSLSLALTYSSSFAMLVLLFMYPMVSNSRVHNHLGSATMGAYVIRRICAAYVTAYALFSFDFDIGFH